MGDAALCFQVDQLTRLCGGCYVGVYGLQAPLGSADDLRLTFVVDLDFPPWQRIRGEGDLERQQAANASYNNLTSNHE
jgi:hypothetical protein